MKNFDLDQIKNRQLQEMPADFYEKMQQNVLDKTILKKKTFEIGKKSKFNWYYAVAASLALVFGGTYVFNNEEVVENPQLTQKEKVATTLPEQNNVAEANTPALTTAEPHKNSEPILLKQKETINNNTPKQKILAKSEIKNNNPADPTKASTPEDQIDFILANFSAEELATLAKNSDQDVYLDLYN